jgi:diacylglycerol kinase family enzyme
VRILICQNPDAGHERVLPEELVDRLQRAGHDVDWIDLKSRPLNDPEIGELDLVVAAGGDGSVGRIARQLVGTAVPIAVLPLGTANNLALILDAGKHDLLDRIAEWSIVPFDAGTIEFDRNGDWFFEGFGVGAFAETAAALTAKDRAGSGESSREAELARDIAALCERSRAQTPFDAEVHVNGKVIYASLLMLEVLNIGRLGPHVELAPDVDPADGLLDVVLVEESQRELLTKFLAKTEAGRRVAPPFTAVRGNEIRVKLPSGLVAHIDGKTSELPSSVDVNLGIERHAVRFLGGSSR